MDTQHMAGVSRTTVADAPTSLVVYIVLRASRGGIIFKSVSPMMNVLALLDKRLANKPPWFAANFDSATGLVKALACCLQGQSFAGVGHVPASRTLARLINVLPWRLQRMIYVKGSAKGAVDPRELGKVDTEDFTRWVTGLYPRKKYPALFIGSANGAAVHLAAAMDLPWLPQTFLIPAQATVRLSADDPVERMEWARPFAQKLLAANPQLALHHMMDPNADRPMLAAASYFRVKLLALGAAYKQFIRQHLQPGGTIFILDCQKSWPVTEVDERHYFQFGGLGDIRPEEYRQGSPRIRTFLQHQDAPVKQWTAPQADSVQPESEWGFAEALGVDIERLAAHQGYTVQRLQFVEPEDLSPLVADAHRWWYQQQGLAASKLLADMFFLMEPYGTLRGGFVPFWLAFNAQPSVDALRRYLQTTDPFDELYLLPFSNGVRTLGQASVADYRSVLSLARRRGAFIGASPDRYPFDFGIYARYEKDIKDLVNGRPLVNTRLSPGELYTFLEKNKGKYKVHWSEKTLSR